MIQFKYSFDEYKIFDNFALSGIKTHKTCVCDKHLTARPQRPHDRD